MSGPKVLVVDDDRDTLTLYTTALKLSGFEVVSAENGVQALRLVDREAPDAVVTDLAMPGMDGVALCRHLRASPLAHQVPVLAVSGQTTPALTADARRAGCDQVLAKPCLPDQLVETLERLMDAPRDRRARGDAPVAARGPDDEPAPAPDDVTQHERPSHEDPSHGRQRGRRRRG